MKRLTALVVIMLSLHMAVQAQRSLVDSPQRSRSVAVYRLSADDLRKIHVQGQTPTRQMMYDCIGTYPDLSAIPPLERGNYLIVEAVQEELKCSCRTVDSFHARFVQGAGAQLLLTDSFGRTIDDARVKAGSRSLRYDPSTRTYDTRKLRDESIIEIDNRGVMHYIKVRSEMPYFRRSGRADRAARKFGGATAASRRSFAVLSKPRYRPGETVRFKAYLTDKSRPFKSEIELHMNIQERDTVLMRLTPYRDGFYEGSFALDAGLGLRLDTRCPIVLRDSRGKVQASASFRYEEYLLAAVTFDTKTERQRYDKGEEVGIVLSAHDENDLPIYDAEVEITLCKGGGDIARYDEYIFIPDTLWHCRMPMAGRRTQRIIIPDSVFIDGASMSCELQCVLTDATGEQHRTWSCFSMDRRPAKIVAAFDRGIMTIRELHDAESVVTRALLTAKNDNGETILRDSVTLPCTAPVNYMADTYNISSADAQKEFNATDYASDILDCELRREDSGARIRIDNPSGIPFWYTVRRDNRIIDSGCATQIDTLYADSRPQPYALQAVYFAGGQSYRLQKELPATQQALSLSVATPDKVYPGQRAEVKVEVKDRRGRPVEGADITAYAYTAKFDRSAAPVPRCDKVIAPRPVVDYTYDHYSLDDHSRLMPLDYALWRDRLGLDTIEYYRFLNPDPIYTHTAAARDSITTLMPYAVVDGRLQNIQLLWVDGQLGYWEHGDGTPVLPVRPGCRRLRMSTADRIIQIDSIDVVKGVKNIVSVDARHSRKGIEVTMRDAESEGMFSDGEYNELLRHVISVRPRFGEVMLSGDSRTSLMPLPAAILSGDAVYRIDPGNWRRGHYHSPYLVGPVPYRIGETDDDGISRLMADTAFIADFNVAGGYRYDIRPGCLSRTSWAQPPISRRMTHYRPATEFRREVATCEGLHDGFVAQLKQRIASRGGRIASRDTVAGRCRLYIDVDLSSAQDGRRPLVTALFDNRGMHSLYYGATHRITDLAAGRYQIAVIMCDSTALRRSIEIRPGGDNCLSLDSTQSVETDSLARAALDRLGRMISVRLPESYAPQRRTHAAGEQYVASQEGTYNADNARDKVITGAVYSQTEGMPLAGATVRIGEEGIAVGTDIDGRFRLPCDSESQITVSYIGYVPYTLRIRSGRDYRIVLQPYNDSLEEVIVTAYADTDKQAFTGSRSSLKKRNSNMLYDSAAEIAVEEAEDEAAAEGAADMPMSFDADTQPEHIAEEEFAEGWREAGSLRHDFRDDAFWQPRITTDAEGRAAFEVAYPDDITAWNANFIAVGKRSRMTQQQIIVRSATPVNARLSLPEFAVRGDSITAVGRLTNYTGDTVEVWRTIITDKADSCRIALADSHIDLIPAAASDADSLQITYSLRTGDGYRDGERRSIPVFRQGVEAVYGKAVVLNDTLPRTFTPDPALGTVTIHAQASGIDWLADEIESLTSYRYSCNEQTASKLKAQLARRAICSARGERFDGDREVKRLIALLTDTKQRTSEGLWGWWSGDRYTPWITAHIVEALTAAQQAGYRVSIDRTRMAEALRLYLDRIIDGGADGRIDSSVQAMIHTLRTLHTLDPQTDCRRYIDAIAAIDDDSVDAWIRYRLAAAELCGIPADRDALLARAKTSFGGGLYWSDRTDRYRWCAPDDDEIATTLAAYRLLRDMGGSEGELAAIRTWLCQRRSEGRWVNTYLSSRIIETILPEFLASKSDGREAAVVIGGRRYDSFPVHLTFEQTEPVTVVGSGTAPVFITLYQSGWEQTPQPRDEGFKVESHLLVDGSEVTRLEKGVEAELCVTVDAAADAAYAMIEIPIPAGCSYLSKQSRSNLWQVYRENFKDRAVVFCNRLPQGRHTFTIKLLPRYTGRYCINPAHARLMYYPTIFGRNAVADCTIDGREQPGTTAK